LFPLLIGKRFVDSFVIDHAVYLVSLSAGKWRVGERVGEMGFQLKRLQFPAVVVELGGGYACEQKNDEHKFGGNGGSHHPIVSRAR
jgi:hypothetical protein